MSEDGYFEKSNILLYVRRTSTRYIKNRETIIDKLKQENKDYVVVDANIGAMRWAHQGLLFMIAKVIIGVHGGGMWNAVRFMSTSQTMLEIMPIGGPGHSKNLVVGHGAKYESVTCNKCTRQTKHIGDMNVDLFFKKMNYILDKDRKS